MENLRYESPASLAAATALLAAEKVLNAFRLVSFHFLAILCVREYSNLKVSLF